MYAEVTSGCVSHVVEVFSINHTIQEKGSMNGHVLGNGDELQADYVHQLVDVELSICRSEFFGHKAIHIDHHYGSWSQLVCLIYNILVKAFILPGFASEILLEASINFSYTLLMFSDIL